MVLLFIFYITPLYTAIKKGNVEVVELLLSNKKIEVNFPIILN